MFYSVFSNRWVTNKMTVERRFSAQLSLSLPSAIKTSIFKNYILSFKLDTNIWRLEPILRDAEHSWHSLPVIALKPICAQLLNPKLKLRLNLPTLLYNISWFNNVGTFGTPCLIFDEHFLLDECWNDINWRLAARPTLLCNKCWTTMLDRLAVALVASHNDGSQLKMRI